MGSLTKRPMKLGLGGGAVDALLGGSPTKVPDRYAIADPVALVPSGVRTVLVHGTGDDIVPLSQSEDYLKVAKDCTLVKVPGDGGRFYGVLLASTDTKSETPVVVWSGFAGGTGQGSEVVLKRNEKSQATSFSLEGRGSLCGREVNARGSRARQVRASTAAGQCQTTTGWWARCR